MARYRYKPLSKNPELCSIRLVTIHPGSGSDDIVVSLQVEPFTQHHFPRYEALSYVWGTRKGSKTIYVGASDRASLRVTTNLRVALQYLRYPDRERVMWIDALCINQSSDVEKGPQVAKMGQIFEFAARVVVWLGPEQNRSGMAMERLAYIGSQIDVDWGGIHRISPSTSSKNVNHDIANPNANLPMDTDQALAVSHLLHRAWFDRLWIRQEILVAEDKAIVCCGWYPPVEWSVFRKAIRLFYSKQPKPGNAVFLLRHRLFSIVGFIFQPRRTVIMSLRGIFDNALCSDPRDRIYGVRALLFQDQQNLCGTPDYTKSTVTVYSDLVRKYITNYADGLTILRQCERPEGMPHWSGPSWVPDWSTRISFHWRHNTFASSQIKGWHAFPKLGTLRVLGVSTTVVKDIQPIPKLHGHDWNLGCAFLRSLATPSIRDTNYPSGCTFVQALLRTIISGAILDFVYIQDGNYPTSQVAEAVLHKVLSGIHFDHQDIKIGSNEQRFFKRMDWGSGGKSFIWGSNGYIGVGPPSTKIGDEIFVIVGCQQPLVLRRHLRDSDEYSVVGECYVEGCARAEPLLGNLPEYVGFSTRSSTTTSDRSWCFRDLRSGELFYEDPRLERLNVDLEDFRAQLVTVPHSMLTVAPTTLLERIKDLIYINLI